MKVLVLMRGAMGAGKSTFLKEQGLEAFTLCPDDYRLRIAGLTMDKEGKVGIGQHRDKEIWPMFWKDVEAKMARGELIVLDATFQREQDFRDARRLAASYHYALHGVDMTTIPMEVAKARNLARAAHKIVPDWVIDRAYANFQNYPSPEGICWHSPEEFAAPPYPIVVAAGRMARFQQPERGEAARDLVAQLLQGIAPAPKPAYTWAQTWTHEKRAALLEKAQEQLAQLLEQLAAWDAALDDEALFDPSSTALAELVQKALYLRDDLESVLVLLRAKEELPDALQAPLRQADRQGLILSRSLPTLPTLTEDPRLQHILSASPDAWWAYPAAEAVLFADGSLVPPTGGRFSLILPR